MDVTSEEKTWALIAHLSGLLGYLAAAVGQFIAPLVIWLIYKDKTRFVAFHALQSLYFQLCVSVGIAVSALLGVITCGVGFVLTVVIVIAALVYPIIAAIKSNSGELFEYPIVGRMARKQCGV
jgi:uncharacterized Tic20 family protein